LNTPLFKGAYGMRSILPHIGSCFQLSFI